MRASEILMRARARIETPAQWAKGWFAWTRNGDRVTSSDPRAVSWCAVGAMHTVGDRPEVRASDYLPARSLLDDAADALAGVDIVELNDAADHATVLEAYDIAASMALSDEAAE